MLQSQIAMTPRGSYRSALETHLDETRDHADRVGDGCGSSARASVPLQTVVGAAETVVGQALALTKTPIDLLRGSGGEEKVLKNAKDACATEALEIATYTALERLAKDLGDEKTAQLAASIRADEERMLARVLREIPQLTDAVVRPWTATSYALSDTGAGEAGQGRARDKATKRAARQARKVPGVAQAEGQVKGAVASEGDLAIDRYGQLTAEEIVAPAAGALAGRPGQDRLLRAPPRQPQHGAGPRLGPARRRAVARLRRADRRAGRVRAVRAATTSASRPSAPTSARTRTARACSTRPSAVDRTPDAPETGHVRARTYSGYQKRRMPSDRGRPSTPELRPPATPARSRPSSRAFSQDELRVIREYEAEREHRARRARPDRGAGGRRAVDRLRRPERRTRSGPRSNMPTRRPRERCSATSASIGRGPA